MVVSLGPLLKAFAELLRLTPICVNRLTSKKKNILHLMEQSRCGTRT
ncbi:MAG: hypothetical protein ABSE15_04640 [Candidatus Bathyarchaeia archaeon]